MASRQREWQKRQRAAGNCVVCGKKALTAQHCLTHARRHAKRNTKPAKAKKDEKTS